MKKWIALILALLVSISLVGCGGETEDNEKSKQDRPASNGDSAEDHAAEPTAEQEDTTEADVQEDAASALVVTPDNVGAVLVDTDGYSFRITGISTDVPPAQWNEIPLAFDFEIVNKSADQEYTVSLGDGSVNGLSAFSGCATSYNPVAAGTTVTNTQSVYYSSVPNDICDYYAVASCATIWLTVEDANENFDRYQIIIYPNGESAAAPYVREEQPSDRLVYDENGIKLTLVGTDMGDDKELFFYIENTTVRPVSISVKGVTINGAACDGSQSIFANPQTANYGYIYFSRRDFENAGVKSQEDIKSLEIIMDLVFDNYDSSFGSRINDVIASFADE